MHLLQFRSLIAGLILALVCFVAAPLSMFVTESRFLFAVLAGSGILVVGYRTVEWGAVLGYRIQHADGTLSGENVFRCLVMTGILVGSVGFIASGFFRIVFGMLR